METIYSHIQTPLGTMLILSDSKALTGLYLEGQKHMPQLQVTWKHQPHAPIFVNAEQQINQYLQGARKAFDLPVKFNGTLFQQTVWNAISSTPYAATISYSQLAINAGHATKSARAVATATGRNPLMLIVPCHRIVGSNGSLTGFAAGIDKKKHLLDLERQNGRSW